MSKAMTRIRPRFGALVPVLFLTLGSSLAAVSATAPAQAAVTLPDAGFTQGIWGSPVKAATQTIGLVGEVRANEATSNKLASLDVRISRTPMRAARQSAWKYPADLQGVAVDPHQYRYDWPNAQVKVAFGQGEVVCLSARAHDTDGNVGAWSRGICTVRYLDDAKLRRSGSLARQHGKAYWRSAATSIRRSGSLTLRGVQAGSQVSVLATRTPLDGRGKAVRAIYTAAHGKRTCFVPRSTDEHRYYSQTTRCEFTTARKGAVTLRTAQRGPSLPVEGIAVLPRWAQLT
jgi:hypothetical protein